VWRAVRHDAPAHPSPNSGVAEAAFAAALGLRLGGVNTYGTRTEHRPQLGRGRAPVGTDITATVALCRDVAHGLMALLLAVAQAG
jgi:adenosylcobinamide-phosphate synthase